MRFLSESKYDDLLQRAEDTSEVTRMLETTLDRFQAQLDSTQWQSIAGNIDRTMGELPWDERNKLMFIAREYWLKDPLVHQGVSLNTHYVFGEGLRYSSNNPEVKQVMDDFWLDEDNQLELTSHQAQEQKSTELQVDGEIFFVLFVNEDNRVKVRTLPPEEITQILSAPGDFRRALYYERRYRNMRYDIPNKRWVPDTADHYDYYPDWHNYAPGQWGFEVGLPKLADGVVYHVAVNKMGWARRGFTETYSVLDWVKAHRGMLQDWATIVKAYSTLAWKAKIKGEDSRDLEKIRQKLMSIFPRFNPEQGQPMEPAGVGGVAFENDSVSLTPMKTAGMATSPSDARQIRLMVGAGLGIMDHYFGDPSTGNLATATAMELPMLKKFTARQRLWESIYRNVLSYAVIKAIDAGRIGSLRIEEDHNNDGILVTRRIAQTGDDTDDININAPPILQADLQSVGQALTLMTKEGILPKIEATRSALAALDLPNADAILELMYPESERVDAYKPVDPIEQALKLQQMKFQDQGNQNQGNGAGAASGGFGGPNGGSADGAPGNG